VNPAIFRIVSFFTFRFPWQKKDCLKRVFLPQSRGGAEKILIDYQFFASLRLCGYLKIYPFKTASKSFMPRDQLLKHVDIFIVAHVLEDLRPDGNTALTKVGLLQDGHVGA
jgi:hypothetical protein